MRFCFLTTFYPPYNFGGDGVAVRRLAQALVRRGHSVTVIHDVDAFDALNRGAWPAAVTDQGGVDVIALRSRIGSLSAVLTHQIGWPVVHGRSIRKVLETGSYDVVMFHNISLIGGPGLLSFGSGAIRLYFAHEHWLVCPTHVLWRYDREACDGRQCVRCVLYHRRPIQVWRQTKYLERQLRHVDAFVVPSEFSRRKHLEFGFPRAMEVLPCVHPDSLAAESGSAAAPQSEGSLPYFLFAGRLEKIKGLDDLIPVVAEMSDVRLVVAGVGTHEHVYRSLAAECPRVEFLGWVNPKRLRSLYEGALGVVAPSRGFETFGLTVMEAFAHGVPVVARSTGAFPELLSHGGGLLFTNRTELASGLRQLLHNPSVRARLSDAARRAYREHWTESVVIPRYLELVKRVAKRVGRNELME